MIRMKNSSAIFILCVLLCACNNCDEKNTGMIFPKGDKINNGNFTGTVYLQQLIAADSLNSAQVGNVTFEPGSRTKWHLHPGGQILLAIDGTGYYQEKGSDKRLLQKGDVVKCPPNIPHWHGASAEKGFVQIAITNTEKGSTVWLNEVSDAEYSSQLKTK